MSGFRSGFVTIVGRPNVGKSTLLNRLVGRKVAIVSDKPQTTRNRIAGVLHLDGAQIVFLDTPGIHRPKHLLGEYMVRVAEATLKEVEAIVFVVDGSEPPGPGDRDVAERLRRVATPVVLAVNKIDAIPRGAVEARVHAYAALGDFHSVVPVSALHGDNVERLVQVLVDLLPEGPAYYPAGVVTDQPERRLVAEVVREKILHLTREEVPHSVAVDVEEMAARREDLLYVRATIYVERDSQKGILIGAGGRMLKEIGRLAREELEALLGTRLYLDLWVKVRPDWRNREAALRQLGYGPE